MTEQEAVLWMNGYFDLQNRIYVLEKELANEKQANLDLQLQISNTEKSNDPLKNRIIKWRGKNERD